jgi:predicted component of type VI protein secretion system
MPLLPYLQIEEGPDTGLNFTTESLQFKVGRGRQSDFRLSGQDPAVSRTHFNVDRRGDNFILTNLSPNKTSVNGVVQDQALLKDNDLIKIGYHTVLRFNLRDQADLEANPNL